MALEVPIRPAPGEVPTEIGSIVEANESGGGVFIKCATGWVYVSVFTSSSEQVQESSLFDLGPVLRVGQGERP